jgi:hypothetical protein
VIRRTKEMTMRGTITAAAAATALLLTACGDGDGDVAAAEPIDGAVPDDELDTDAVAEQSDTDAPVEELDADEPVEELGPEDGWNGVHDGVTIPPPGEGVLVVDGQTIELEVSCPEPSWLVTGGGETHFAVLGRGDGVDDQGRETYVEVSRVLVPLEEAATSVYDYQGQERATIQIVVQVEENQYHSSIIVTPGDDDPTGAELPLVRVDESGSFSVLHDDVPPLHASIHDQALHGAVELAGTCPDGWPEAA